MDIATSNANRACYAIESRFIGQFAWFSDYVDAVVFLKGLGESIHENHWKIVELV